MNTEPTPETPVEQTAQQEQEQKAARLKLKMKAFAQINKTLTAMPIEDARQILAATHVLFAP